MARQASHAGDHPSAKYCNDPARGNITHQRAVFYIMKANEIVAESNTFTNVNVNVTLDGATMSQNISPIKIGNSNYELEYMMHSLKKKNPAAHTALRTQMGQVRDRATKTLQDLTEAYYATAYSVLANAQQGLSQAVSDTLAQNGIDSNDPL